MYCNKNCHEKHPEYMSMIYPSVNVYVNKCIVKINRTSIGLSAVNIYPFPTVIISYVLCQIPMTCICPNLKCHAQCILVHR